MAEKILEIKNVEKFYRQGKHIQNHILNHLDLDLYRGDFTVIMGSSGAGKSTLLYAMSGMDAVDAGEILYHGKDINKLSEKEMAKLRTHDFGFVFQQGNLVSNLTVEENLLVAGFAAKQKDCRKRAEELCRIMGIYEIRNQLVTNISGGEASRVAIARAVMNKPEILFADEPTGALNKANSVEVLKMFTELNEKGQSIIMVTHDLQAALHGNRILYLEDGKVLGELKLDTYREDAKKEREQSLTEWICKFSW